APVTRGAQPFAQTLEGDAGTVCLVRELERLAVVLQVRVAESDVVQHLRVLRVELRGFLQLPPRLVGALALHQVEGVERMHLRVVGAEADGAYEIALAGVSRAFRLPGGRALGEAHHRVQRAMMVREGT